MTFQTAVYILCIITSVVAMLLLFRAYLQTRTPLLLWSALAFVALALTDVLRFIDIVLLPPEISLLWMRELAAGVAVLVLLYGFIWEAD